jgi:hypothetical protein
MLCNALKKVLLAADMIVGRHRSCAEMVGEMAYRQRFEPVPIKKTERLGQQAVACQRLGRSPRPQRSERNAATASLPLERQVSRKMKCWIVSTKLSNSVGATPFGARTGRRPPQRSRGTRRYYE